MACVTTIDWGSVADWVSGIGSAAAAIVAVVVAGQPGRLSKRERAIAAAAETERQAHIKAEAINIAGQMEAELRQFGQLVRLGGGETGASRREVMDQIEVTKSQLLALQRLPNVEIRLFSQIGRLIGLLHFPSEFMSHGGSYSGLVADSMANRVAAARKTIASLEIR